MSDQTAEPGSTNRGDGTAFSRRGLLRACAGRRRCGRRRWRGLLEACSSGIKGLKRAALIGASARQRRDIPIGCIHPLTGPLAGFGAADNWVVSKIMASSQYKNGFKIGGKTYTVNIKSYDTQSSDTRAGQLAQQAINADRVDMLFASSTPETVNAVASTAENPRHATGLRELPLGGVVPQPVQGDLAKPTLKAT